MPKIPALLLTLTAALLPLPVAAQVIGTFGTVVNGTYDISGGQPAGSNLFHSFLDFSPQNNPVTFLNDPSLTNIFVRVLGTNPSVINGAIATSNPANLFLLNPNGITFGNNARLNLNGSFIASTAHSLIFPDGREFSTLNTTATDLLSVQVPIGLRFAQTAAGIMLTGNGAVIPNGPNESRISLTGCHALCQSSLTAAANQAITLLGGPVTLDGGNLLAPNGRLAVGSVGAGQIVGLNPDFSLNYGGVTAFQDIRLFNRASIDSSGVRGGAIQVQGRNLDLSGGGAIASITTGANTTGQTLQINATGTIRLDSSSSPISRIFTEANATGGIGGNIAINTGQLLATGGGEVSARVANLGGRSGDLTITGQQMTIQGVSPGGVRSTVAIAHGASTGQGGTATINVANINLDDQGQILARTTSNGNAGNIVINSNSLTMARESTIRSSAERFSGNGGNITINSQTLNLNSGAQITTSTLAAGNAGTLRIKAADIFLTGGSTNPTSLTANVASPTATGSGGRLTLETQRLTLNNGAQISTGTFGVGNGSDTSITASESIAINGLGKNPAGKTFFSGIFTQTDATGQGNSGNLSLETGRLTITDGGVISVGTIGTGQGGNLTINAREQVTVTGFGEQLPSGISSRTRTGAQAGTVTMNTDILRVSDRATVTVESLGIANAGNLDINARLIQLENQGTITAATTSGQGGNINLNALHIILLFDSEISTTAGTANQPGDGGNITINAATVTGLFNSDIISNSFRGRGGRIVITAEGIFGLKFRLQRTPENDITAFSLFSPELNGEVILNTPGIDPTQALIDVPVVDSPEVVQQVCGLRAGTAADSGLRFQGRGIPREGFGGVAVLPVVMPEGGDAPMLSSSNPINPNPRPLIAQGWGRNAQGQLVLTAQAPTAPTLLLSAVGCPAA
ncbi:S-layer family protein [Spirulina sp. CCNP1310]|uniref:S-layer family protein n=1 Tax=Spirulina sp. CCNP1310 TaxID=3110249 RepID=UPI002B1EA2EB|nr:S-layer family protein [Spirulina sp. CCNP1310]MEA5417831.1 S-layer family protein [Spirulina sp. CCNP1310]